MKYRVVVTVKSVKGYCDAEHKVGDRIELVGAKLSSPICPVALCSMYPQIHAMKYGAEFPWAEDKNRITYPCPDLENLVVFELRREKIEE